MKSTILITLLSLLLLFSCRREINKSKAESGNGKFYKNTAEIELPENMCGLISVEEITSHFEVQKVDLDVEDDNSKCGYSWKKSNFEKLREQQIKTIYNFAKDESGLKLDEERISNTTLSDIVESKSPYNTVQVGDFTKYNNLPKAIDYFTRIHKTPTKEEIKRLKRKIEKEHPNGKVFEINRKMKFKKITGIGDQAYYNYSDMSLDIRFGILSFRIYIDSEKDLKTNIQIAKKLAKSVWKKL